ncbi:alpha-ketoglutarate-dependent dioxygenase AlkB [Polynucleobacter sp. MG-27-Goln-C1]|uniref:alpha-ketoglutarate-dependent dioxygenase AlkB family protein n=1 Tax=Polynucleobacter sp. MG-27-Goln-C1 TaxID=1819726 RepID=UPI001C0B2AD4|nr:alpha-ketoglutarate-dependent dioxygenase AlkB [Polynucleobacter sp. MG-27-Goln-C1]MBU3611394.1 alpha-ketoglutarate-dependent dioxygenase AlkB [Polynucleobacter sp. MG-27-Goln-C1]
MQNTLFEHLNSSEPIVVLEKDGRAEYINNFFDADASDSLFKTLLGSLAWELDQIQMFGKLLTTARKVAWVGDPECLYTYSGIQKTPQNWTNELLKIKAQLEQVTGSTYNSCLLNLYHAGAEGMGWHSDNEKELDSTTPIASISLGARRKFAFRHKQDKTTTSVFLEHGSLLIMHPPIQEHWHHSLLKTKAVIDPRINLTFRKILPRI